MALTFPTPVGGTALSSDFAPSIIMAVLFGLLYPFMIYRSVVKGSRNTLFINTILMLCERPVIYSLRAVQANQESFRLSKGLLKYMQVSFALGYVTLAQDLPRVLRTIIVNASLPSEDSEAVLQLNNVQVQRDYSNSGLVPEPNQITAENHPRMRFWIRRGSDLLNLVYIAAIVPGIIAGFQIGNSVGSQNLSTGNRSMALRYASASVALFLSLSMAFWMAFAMSKLPRIRREAGLVFITICISLSIPPLYRLSVMYLRTTGTILSQSTHDADALNRPVDKALFYIFHILPEFAVGYITFVRYNMRELCGLGLTGDELWKDETPEQKEKREREKAERKAKKARKSQKQVGLVVDV